MHGSSCSYVPQGFPAMSINMVETGLVADRTDPTHGVWYVLQNLGSKDAIEGVVGKLQPRRIPRYPGDPLKREVRPFEIQRGHLVKILCQDLREVAVPSADIQH